MGQILHSKALTYNWNLTNVQCTSNPSPPCPGLQLTPRVPSYKLKNQCPCIWVGATPCQSSWLGERNTSPPPTQTRVLMESCAYPTSFQLYANIERMSFHNVLVFESWSAKFQRNGWVITFFFFFFLGRLGSEVLEEFKEESLDKTSFWKIFSKVHFFFWLSAMSHYSHKWTSTKKMKART